MQKSNKSIAGYHLLMILSAVDYQFNIEEEKVIVQFLEEEFPFRLNLDNEMAEISNLAPKDWKKHFSFHAQCFYDDSVDKERQSFLQFAEKLIKIDNKVEKKENEFFQILQTTFNAVD